MVGYELRCKGVSAGACGAPAPVFILLPIYKVIIWVGQTGLRAWTEPSWEERWVKTGAEVPLTDACIGAAIIAAHTACKLQQYCGEVREALKAIQSPEPQSV